MSATLTDRYIAATLRGVPAEAHDDVRNELTGSIADAVEARIEQGESPDEAERAALNELGDPAVLAAGLADRRLQLIGPRHYLTWLRLLRLLLAIVPASVAVLVALGYAISGADVGDIIAEGIVSGITAGLHVCVWTTLAFAVMDRLGAAGSPRWNVDRLPENRSTGRGLADLIAVAILMPVAAFAFVWDRYFGFIFLHGEAYPIWNPALWPWWMAAVFVLFAMAIVVQAVVFVRGRWTTRIAIVNTALQVMGASSVPHAAGPWRAVQSRDARGADGRERRDIRDAARARGGIRLLRSLRDRGRGHHRLLAQDRPRCADCVGRTSGSRGSFTGSSSAR